MKEETTASTIQVTPAQSALLAFFSKTEAPQRLRELFALDNFIWSNIIDSPNIGRCHTEAFYFHNALKEHLLELIQE